MYELRPLYYRVLYTYVEDMAVVLVLCEKKQSEIPRRCIDLAIKRSKKISNK
ncbi:hypothetical protein FO441_01330 [Salinicoccus cyprini]|uniref:Type II toxin-antitoxin system RelE/ParE family toxin n=1 Tax=Salinicoccus cyprini TaxID=2493691 RepID=A0A558B025_9STAP|nr:hypothetical protein FO441_01330 [Salinicoccus cyprini]